MKKQQIIDAIYSVEVEHRNQKQTHNILDTKAIEIEQPEQSTTVTDEEIQNEEVQHEEVQNESVQKLVFDETIDDVIPDFIQP